MHGGLLLSGTYRGTYDAYVHIFLADHYARNWWSVWDTRWYTGFTTVSYPPLTHQLTALISKFLSLPTGFMIVMLVATVMTTLGVYRFSRLWVDERPATYAALITIFSSSIAETVHVFGQLPTMFVMGVMLNALPFVWRWVEHGKFTDLFRGWALLMVAAAGHHVTTLFGMVFFSGPIFATVLLIKFRTPRLDEDEHPIHISIRTLSRLVTYRAKRVAPAFVRCGVFGVGLILTLVITVLPYWLWSKSDPITQITIPHASRDSFIANSAAGFMFFVLPWGVLICALPYAVYKGFGTRNWILASSLAGLALLGTGGTTPIPAALLKGAFWILTLDRFTFWATIVILPFAGQFVESLLHGRLGDWIVGHLGMIWKGILLFGMLLSLMAMAIFTSNLTQLRKFQPAPIDMIPIVEFLAKDNHDKWRYLTLGFGDQMAWLSAQTTALNVEGNYHSARRLPEMTSTPVERLDGAKFTSIPGLGSLEQFLTNPHKYNLKYVFVNDGFYEPILYFSGWHRLGALDNDVQVWERSDVPPLPASIPVVVYPAWQRFMWGALPVGSIFIAITVFTVTGLIVPRFHISPIRIPIVRMIARRRWIQNWLVDYADDVSNEGTEDWQFWKRIARRFVPTMNLRPLPRRGLYGLLFIFLITIVGFMIARTLVQKVTSPEAILLNYYDDLDFKRYARSYDYLETEMTTEEYLRWLSLRGGIVASFAKLENLYTDIDIIDDTHLRASVREEWFTSIGTYKRSAQYDMVNTNSGWRIVLDAEPPPLPRETFLSTSENRFFIDLPISTLDVGALTRGVLDRSNLSVSEVSFVYAPEIPIGFAPEYYDAGRIEGRFEGLLSIMGEVANRDVYPAHVTVTAIMYDAYDHQLAKTNVKDVMLHQLLPGEVTPFRVDFFGADAADLIDITDIRRVELIIQGVPTSHNLARPLILQSEGFLYNSGTEIVDIPHVLIRYQNPDGTLNWVDHVYLEYSIGADETGEFLRPRLPRGLEHLDIPVSVSGPRLVDWQNVPLSDYVIHGYSR